MTTLELFGFDTKSHYLRFLNGLISTVYTSTTFKTIQHCSRCQCWKPSQVTSLFRKISRCPLVSISAVFWACVC